MVLRAVDRFAKVLDIHSDARTDKVVALLTDSRAGLLFWDAARQLQLRIEGVARVIDAASAEGDAVFSELSDRARSAYRHGPDPKTPISAADGYDDREDARVRFRLIRIEARRMEALSLADGTQARAEWIGARSWSEASWLVP